jgi:hypothetical protein
MKRAPLLVVAALALTTSHLDAQASKSRSAGFFLGGGLEGDGVKEDTPVARDRSGGGGGVVVGYGFNQRWSLFSQIGVAQVTSPDFPDHRYALGHLDLGARIHFRTGPNVVVPFLQFGVTGRTELDDVAGVGFSSTGAGLSVGGGFNAHFSPSVAFSTAATWTFGNFNAFKVDGETVDRDPVRVTTARIQVGIVWFIRRR